MEKGMNRTCADCGKEFLLTQGEINFYKGKGLSLPKRCKECRDARKNGGKAEKKSAANSAKADIKPEGKGSSGKKSGKKKLLPVILVVLAAVIGLIFGLPDNGGENLPGTDPVYGGDAAQTGADTDGQDSGDDIFAEENYTSAYTASEGKTEAVEYSFRNQKLLDQHYEKHGREMGFSSAEAYEDAAEAVINDPDALTKTEKEDGDTVYYIVSTNEFVILSTDGYIRTYFNPDGGLDYYNRQ